MEWLDRLAAPSRGIVTRDDLRPFATKDEIDGLVARGQLIPEFRGVYRTAGAPRTLESQAIAACKAAGAGAFPSHGTAARFKAMRYVPSGRLEITAPRRVRLPGVIAYQSNCTPPSHLTYDKRVGLYVPTPARIVCDLAKRLSQDTLAKVLDTARRDKKLSYDEVWQCRDDLRARGRRRTTVLDSLLARRVPGLEGDESEGEARLLGWILNAGLVPEQQYWVVLNGMRYRCDLAFPTHKVDVEWDAFSTHGKDRGAFDYDKLRDDDFDAAGWGVIRVTEAWSPERTVAAVRRHLRPAA